MTAWPASSAAPLKHRRPGEPEKISGIGRASRNDVSPVARSCARKTRSGDSPVISVTIWGPADRSSASTASSRPGWPVSQAFPQETRAAEIGESVRTPTTIRQ